MNSKRDQGDGPITFLETMVALAAVAVLIVAFMNSETSLHRAKKRALRISCSGNLKQTSLAFRGFGVDNGEKFPMQFSNTNATADNFSSALLKQLGGATNKPVSP